jgi:hypothetical protein
MHGVLHAPAPGLFYGVARFISSFEYFELLSTILEHLRHEWKLIEFAIFIKSTEYFFLGPHLNNFSDSEVQRKVLRSTVSSHLLALCLVCFLPILFGMLWDTVDSSEI